MIPGLVVLALTVTFSPPKPTVGDPVTIEFPAPVSLDPSAGYEVVAHEGNRVVVRTFTPKPFTMSGVAGGVGFSNLTVPVQSVLGPNDDLTPAPLAPPRDAPYERGPFLAIGGAALTAALAWLAVWLRSRRRVTVVEPAIAPEERFRRAVFLLQQSPSRPMRWAALADETRALLAATRPYLGAPLTTSELVPRLSENERVVAEILRQGDLEKFSGRGAAPRDFDEIALRALALLDSAESEESAA